MLVRHVRVAVVVVALLVLPTAAIAQSGVDDARQKVQDLQDEADQAREQASKLGDKVGNVEARLGAAQSKLDDLQPRVDAAGKALSDADDRARTADRKADLARARAQGLQDQLEAAMAQLQENQDQRAAAVRDTYMYGPGIANPSMAAMQVFEGSSPTDAADVIHTLDVLLADQSLLVQDSVRLTETTRILAQRAERAKRDSEADAQVATDALDQAAQRHAELLDLLSKADAAVGEQQQAVAELERQQADARAAVKELESATGQAKQEVQRRVEAAKQAEREAAARLKRAKQEQQRQQQAAAPPGQSSSSSSDDGGGGGGGGGGVTTTVVNSNLVTVGGITVDKSIGPSLEALLNAARADGIVLGGGGYRSPRTTARLRIANGCPDIYNSPSSSCRVPTARPGTSMHEQGLAIDFTWRGRTICFPYGPSGCRGNAAFDWLQAHAGEYGLHGISTEAWHYSTNGH